MAGPSPANQKLAQGGWSGPAAVPAITPTGQNIDTGINTGSAAPYEQAQSGLLAQLQAEAAGKGGPTVAQQQLQAGQNATLAGALAQTAASTRMGQNPGAAAGQAERAAAATNAEGAASAANLRAQEIEAARAGVGQLSTAAAGQQIGLGEAQGQLGVQGQEFGATQGQKAQEFGTGLANQNTQQYNAAISGLQNLNQGAANQEMLGAEGTLTGIPGDVSQAAGSLAKLSDERAKTAVDSAAGSSKAFLEALRTKLPPQSAGELSHRNVPESAEQSLEAPPTDVELGSHVDVGAPGEPDISTQAPIMLPRGSTHTSAETARTMRPYQSTVAPQATAAGSPATPAGMPAPLPAQLQTSDEDQKLNVDKLGDHSYEYKHPDAPGAAPGTHYGPMAQELEASGPIGASTVSAGQDGVKRVDTGRLALALAGAGADLSHRVSTLEEALKVKHASGKARK